MGSVAVDDRPKILETVGRGTAAHSGSGCQLQALHGVYGAVQTSACQISACRSARIPHRKPIGVPRHPLPLDLRLQIDSVMSRHQQDLRQNIRKLGSKAQFQLIWRASLISGLSRAHEERLRQLTDFFLKLEQEPGVVPGYPMLAGIGARYRFDLVCELPQIHAGSVRGQGRQPKAFQLRQPTKRTGTTLTIAWRWLISIPTVRRFVPHPRLTEQQADEGAPHRRTLRQAACRTHGRNPGRHPPSRLELDGDEHVATP